MKKGRILYVSYQTPPHGGARGIRILHIIKYLSDFGWKLDVLTISPSINSSFYDPGLVNKLPSSATLFRTYPGVFRKLYQNRIRIRATSEESETDGIIEDIKKQISGLAMESIEKISGVAIPDIMIEWCPFALLRGIKLVRQNKYDVLISSAFPYTSHLIAFTIKKISNLPWIVEYSDPWVFEPSRKQAGIRFRLEYALEKRVLKSADVLVITTEETKRNYLKNYPFLNQEKVVVMPAGADYDDFSNLMPAKSNRFRILYTGRMYKVQDIKPFLVAIKKLVMEDAESKRNMEVLFVGNIERKYKDLIEEEGLEDIISVRDFVPLKEALSLTIGADIFLFLGNKGGLQVPSRLFYYLAAGRPILYIKGDDKDPSLRFLTSLNRGHIVGNNPEEISSAIITLYNLYKKYQLEEAFDLSPLPEISWENRIKILDEICKTIIRGDVKNGR
jgi:glycosyltransferase involved in cell wall biosynthesis